MNATSRNGGGYRNGEVLEDLAALDAEVAAAQTALATAAREVAQQRAFGPRALMNLPRGRRG